MYEVYILYSRGKDRYYTGVTSVGVELRLQRHNEGWTRSTKSGIPWELCYREGYESKTEALKRENEIKSWKSRKRMEELIGSREK